MNEKQKPILSIRVIDNREKRLEEYIPFLETVHNQAVMNKLDGFKKGTFISGINYYICNPFFDINMDFNKTLVYNSIMNDSKNKGFFAVMFLID